MTSKKACLSSIIVLASLTCGNDTVSANHLSATGDKFDDCSTLVEKDVAPKDELEMLAWSSSQTTDDADRDYEDFLDDDSFNDDSFISQNETDKMFENLTDDRLLDELDEDRKAESAFSKKKRFHLPIATPDVVIEELRRLVSSIGSSKEDVSVPYNRKLGMAVAKRKIALPQTGEGFSYYPALLGLMILGLTPIMIPKKINN
ncbi:TPA: LPXTG cell wall anchor domain-containing protein [Streptococcus pyogenes]